MSVNNVEALEAPKKVRNIVRSGGGSFDRKEYKFMIPNEIIDIVIPDLLRHLEYDEFSRHGFYPIWSVYFDTYDLQMYSSKMAGLMHRRKLRVRTYQSDPEDDEPVFLEVKEKNGSRIHKKRMPLTVQQLNDLITNKHLPDVDDPAYVDWRYALIKDGVRPHFLNYYKRQAFESESYPGLRITIDRDISYSPVSSVDFNLPLKKVYWAHTHSVIEIKFDVYLPLFIVEMIRRYNFTAIPISKYADSVISNFFLNTT